MLRYFVELGYSARRNVVIRGFSGARHEIDVLLSTPDGRISVVEVKNYSKPVSKEWVMKIHQIAQDIGASEAFLVSASGFTDGAIKVAKILGVRLLDLNDMVSALQYRRSLLKVRKLYIEHRYDLDIALNYAKSYILKRLFKPVEVSSDAEAFFYPFFLLRGIYTYAETEGFLLRRTVERAREAIMLIDSLTGGLPYFSDRGRFIEFVDVTGLKDDQLAVLALLLNERLTRKELEARLGWSRYKLSRILNALISRDLITYDEKTGTYEASVPSLEEVEEVVYSLPTAAIVEGEPSPCIRPRMTPTVAKSLALALYGLRETVVEVLYLPLYRVKLKKIGSPAFRYVYLAAWMDKPVSVVLNL